MKKLPALLLVLLFAATGCTSTRSDWPFPDRRHETRRHETRRADPVVGRTTDGRRIYEERRTGRIYTIDRRGRRVYQTRVYEHERIQTKSKGHVNRRRGNGRKVGHRKHDKHDHHENRRDRDDR